MLPWRVLDVFAGCGGFGVGFEEAGFEMVAAVEKFRTACESYAANVRTGLVLEADVRGLTPDDVPVADVLIGGPPCEAFTPANADRRADPLDRLYKDPRGGMTLQFVKLVSAFEPEAFLMENVPGVREGPLEGELRTLFRRAGYGRIHFHDLLAEDYGTPSHRRRVFVSNLDLKPHLKPVRTPATVRSTIGDLVSLDTEVENHVPEGVKGKRARRISDLAPGESLYHYRAASGRVHGAWTRLRGEALAPTVKGLDRFVHYEEDRLLTPREHARLMGYPDEFVFRGSVTEQYNQVGESVPPPLARQLGDAVARALGEP